MKSSVIENVFKKEVKNKFNIYNSLFLNLPYPKVSHIGMLIPLLQEASKIGLEEGKEPSQILDLFFSTHTKINSEDEIIDFMFRVIQYVERQVVLYDSVEDASFQKLIQLENNLSLNDYLHLINENINKEKFIEHFANFSTRIVFTAHPTQFYPPSVLDIISQLRKLITQNDINNIDLTLQQLGLTSLLNPEKPTPFDEAKNIIYYLRDVYYESVSEIYSNIKKSIDDVKFDNPNLIQFGFWPGGDRDGNPFVTAETTLKVADELRSTLMKCYYNDLKQLRQKLTFRKVDNILNSLIENIYKTVYDNNETINSSYILNSLYEIREIVLEFYNGLYFEEVEKIINKVNIFGVHFASIDIRQNDLVHKQCVEHILQVSNIIKHNLDELNNEELINVLLNENIEIKVNDLQNELMSDTAKNISNLKLIQSKNGEKGCHRYIISNSEDKFSVLFVFALLRWFGWKAGNIPIDIVPLFESIEGMKNSGKIMTELFEIKEYRNHLLQRNNFQTIMLGFSDGTKDGGYLQANWSIFKTKEILTDVCKKYGVKVIFFDGRGGPPARGGGKTHNFYASQSDRIANNAIQITIQGQTITSKFGTKEHFKHNVEQLLTAGLSQTLFNKQNLISEEASELIEQLAKLSHIKYTSLKNHKMFIPYLERKSTLKYYGATNIGSRPTRRGNSEKLNLDDLRAIPFVGSWSQLKQNVPGYYGVGSAIKQLVDEGKEEHLRQLFKDIPFFKALIQNSMMSLSKCNFQLTNYIKRDKDFGEFWNLLFQEYELSKEMVLRISGNKILMEEEPVSKNSIEIRENIVLPLLIIQQAALQKIENNSPYKHDYEKIVVRSLYGNINASRNSA